MKCLPIFGLKILWKRLFRRPRYFEGNIEMDLKKTEYMGVNWAHLGQGRLQWRALVNT
jgi:hypothetical protein